MRSQAETNQAEMKALFETVVTELARLPHLASEALSLAGRSPSELAPTDVFHLPAHVRTELNRALDRIDGLVQRHATLERIEHQRRERGE